MRFDSPLEQNETKTNEMWDDMAFVICSENKNDLNDLMAKVHKFKHTTINLPSNIGKK
jgi:hypothetical protein